MVRLPELFKVIIDHDRQKPRLDVRVVRLHAYREWMDRRDELRRAAQAFIKRQRGGGTAGAGG